MAVDLAMAKRFAGIPDEAEDSVFAGCVAAAEAWYAAAGVGPMLAGEPLYDFWIANLAAWMYDNRGDAESGRQVPTYIVTSVHALRYLVKQAEAGAGGGAG